MRVVLDANIFASALIRPQGPPGKILTLLLREQAFELVLSPAILEEVGRVLRYQGADGGSAGEEVPHHVRPGP